MFGKKSSGGGIGRPELLSASLNTIAKGTSITGDISSEGIIRIDGMLKGKVRTKAKIAIGKSGQVEGDIHCDEADIEGQITGTVTVHSRLTIRSHGRVNGDIQTGRLIVEPGAVFNGSCQMGSQEKMAQTDRHADRTTDRQGPSLQKEAV